jgi:putative Ca2+/H+ antiporter (TMEM165/GDT1 family)
VDFLLVLLVFGVILIAELPDKSMFAALVLSTKLPPRYVFLGAAAAFAVHVIIAIMAGSVLSLLPGRLLDVIVAAVFVIGAVLLLRESRQPPETAEDADAIDTGHRGAWPAMAASFGVIFLGEWGDITQLTTANLAAKYDSPVLVGIGAVLGLWTAAFLGIAVGKTLLTKISSSLLLRIGAAVFAVFAAISVIDAV